MRLILATVLAAVAMFFWGFLYWAANDLPYKALEMPEDPEAARAAISDHFPRTGTWMVPGMNLSSGLSKEELEALHQQGPNGILHIRIEEPSMNASMLQGFLGMLATAFCLAVLLQKVVQLFPNYADRVRYTASIGMVGAILIDLGNSAWWFNAWGWQMYQLFYHISACLVAGLVLAAFIKPEAERAES